MDKLYTPGRVAALFTAVMLAACGGGGDDAAAPSPSGTATSPVAGTPPAPAPVSPAPSSPAPAPATPTPAPSPTPTPAPAPTPTPSPAPAPAEAVGDCNVANFVEEALAMVNDFRSQPRSCGGTSYPAVRALAWNSKLTQAAYGHSLDMATQNYFDHTSKDGRSFSQRITAAGYTWSSAAENIAAGYPTMSAVMTGWQNSAGHCKNLMSSTVTEVGLSCVKGKAGAAYGTYWTMELAKPR